MEITNQVLDHLPWKKKSTPSGWISFNAPCCQHLGHSPDTRGRGGIHVTPEGGINFHCFNCHFTTGWQPGRRLSYKMRRFMNWLGMGEELIGRLALFAISQETPEEIVAAQRELPTFEPREPCPGRPITSWLNDGHITEEDYNSLEAAINYLDRRGFGDKLDQFYWTDDAALRDRVLVPFTWNNKPMGYSGRLFVDGKKKIKYYSNYPSNLIWGYDKQHKAAKFCIVVEGTLDAVAINAIAICSNEVNDVQAEVIETLDRDIIVVPDRDKAGRAMVDAALKYGWSVSFPDWETGIKDVADAVAKYGHTFTMRSILSSVEQFNLKIKLKSKGWFF
jgi:hypothetical protein